MASSQSLISGVIASPDGKRVYVLSSDLSSSSSGSSQVTANDTDTNTVAYVQANKPALLIDQLEVKTVCNLGEIADSPTDGSGYCS